MDARAVRASRAEGNRNIAALVRGLDRAVGEDAYPQPLVGDLSMFYFDLIKGRVLLERLTRFSGTQDEAARLLLELQLQCEELRSSAAHLVPEVKKLVTAAYKATDQPATSKARRPRKR